ncbi:unnamed protein product [Callosobruchus maculatus]|uniref:Uncharacterized protein n=1 Tax=Callosobruchus maculatus TaxID=64391 RepID=A0A653C5H9_CALMS|nr:unnamed protein product [Callosobruchus maculatus]
MSARALVLLHILGCCCGVLSFKISDVFPVCKQNDDQCLSAAIEKALHYLCDNGLPELKLPKLDPIAIPEISIGTKGSAADISQKYIDVKLHGFKKASVSNAHLDMDKKKLTFTVFAPQLDQVSSYDFNGRILIFPIRGQGKAVLSQSNVTVYHTIQLETVKKQDKDYFKVVSYVISTNPSKTSFKVDNLFNGNEALSERVHQVVNDNWKILWDEAKADVDLTYAKVYETFAQKVFSKVPISELVLQA